MKDLGRANGVLTRHRIGNKQNLDRFRLGLDPLELDHQLVVYVKTAGRIDHQRVKAHLLRVLHRTADEGHRIVRFLVLEDGYADSTADYAKLLAGRRPVYVD